MRFLMCVWPCEGSGCSEPGGEVQNRTSHVDQADWGAETAEEIQEIESWQREDGDQFFPFLNFSLQASSSEALMECFVTFRSGVVAA